MRARLAKARGRTWSNALMGARKIIAVAAGGKEGLSEWGHAHRAAVGYGFAVPFGHPARPLATRHSRSLSWPPVQSEELPIAPSQARTKRMQLAAKSGTQKTGAPNAQRTEAHLPSSKNGTHACRCPKQNPPSTVSY